MITIIIHIIFFIRSILLGLFNYDFIVNYLFLYYSHVTIVIIIVVIIIM